MSFLSFFFVYTIGGFTFLPLCLVAAYFFLRWYLPKVPEVQQFLKKELNPVDDLAPYSDNKARREYEKIKVTELEEKENSGVNVFKSGWLTVTTEYYEFPQNSSNEKNNEPENNKSAYTTLYKLVKKAPLKMENAETVENENEEEDNLAEDFGDKASSTTNTANPNNQRRRKNKYFAVLRHGNLFLYKDEDQNDVLHVIVLSNHVISLWPRDLPDGQLFSKMSAICVLRKDISKIHSTGESRLPPPPPPKDSAAFIEFNSQNKSTTTLDILENGHIPPKSATFYIYADSNYEKEDWYFDLLRATKRNAPLKTGSTKDLLEPTIFAKTFHPKTADMINLIQNLHSSEEQLHTRWFNAIIGRIFLALYGTEEFENYIKYKLLNKLQKINKPGFLDEFKIEKVFIGKSAPLLTSPRLSKLTPEGDLEVDASVFYNGGISFQVSTKVNINLGTRFKPRDISILLAVTVKQLQGDVVFKIKRPPTERIWWGFKTMPYIDLSVEPVVSTRQITKGMITRTIENKLKESIKESLVLPAMDDITFFSTKDEIFRGGVWDKSERPKINREDKKRQMENTDSPHYPDPDYLRTSPTKTSEDADDARTRSQSFASSMKSTILTDGDNDNELENAKQINGENSSQFFNDLKSSSASIFSFKKDGKDKNSINSFSSSLKKSLSKNVPVTPKVKKSDSTVKISNDQFLADGSFIANESDENQDTGRGKDPNASLSKSHNSELLEGFNGNADLDALDAEKKFASKSLKKIGKWYFKEKEGEGQEQVGETNDDSPITSSVAQSSTKPNYKPPEMISSRRIPRNKSKDPSSHDLSFESQEIIKNEAPKVTDSFTSGQASLPKSVSNPSINQQPYGKIPEMTLPATRSPSQFIATGTHPPKLPPRSNNSLKRRPPPKSAEDNDELRLLI